MKSDRSAIVFDLSVVINVFVNGKSIKAETIGEFCYKNVLKTYLNNLKDVQELIL